MGPGGLPWQEVGLDMEVKGDPNTGQVHVKIFLRETKTEKPRTERGSSAVAQHGSGCGLSSLALTLDPGGQSFLRKPAEPRACGHGPGQAWPGSEVGSPADSLWIFPGPCQRLGMSAEPTEPHSERGSTQPSPPGPAPPAGTGWSRSDTWPEPLAPTLSSWPRVC